MQTKLRQILTAEITSQRKSPQLDRRWLFICAAVLTALVFMAYGRTLTTFFLADDFGEVAYVSRIADSGRWDLFWSNWTGNFMQIPGMAVYRPLLLVSLLSDYLLWKSNAVGFYLTNMLFYLGDTLVIFLLGLSLTKQWGQTRALMTGFAGAALFAVNPLHCETVSWVVGRVDSSCLLFSLTSVLCFVVYCEKQKTAWMAASIGCFCAGILFKEMAIGVPILITAIAVIFRRDWKMPEAAIAIGKLVGPIWIATAVYFVVRFIVLGMLTGGYTGAIGDGQAGSAFARWLDPYTYERVVLPFAASLFPTNSGLLNLTKLIYASCFTLLALRLLRRDLPWRFVALLGAWIFSAAVPIYKLWGIGMDLEGARFCFFLTVPLSVLLPVLLFAPSNKSSPEDDRTNLLFSAAVLCALAFISYKVALHSNANWVHAGKEVRAVLSSASRLATDNTGKNIAVLGIPKVRSGAHMIYNGATFRTMLDPPFVPTPLSSRFLTFDPIFYGPDQYINADRFRSTMTDSKVAGVYVWNSPAKSFNRLELQPEAHTASPVKFAVTAGTAITNPKVGDGVVLPLASPVNPWLFDYMEVRFHAAKPPTALKFSVSWQGAAMGADSDKNTAERLVVPVSGKSDYTARIPVSHYWRWFAAGAVTKLTLYTPGAQNLQIDSIALVPAKTVRPALSVLVKTDDGSGVYAVEPTVQFSANALSVPGATSLLIECSKANYFFDQIEEKDQLTAVHKRFTAPGNSYSASLPNDFLPRQQYCELRVRALASDGTPIGEYSEPVIVYAK